jgi:hypothetical protein
MLPFKKLKLKPPLYKNIKENIADTNEWIILAHTTCDTIIYKYNILQPNKIEYLRFYCKSNLENIFNNTNAFFCYFFDEETIAGPMLHPCFYFLAKPQQKKIILQDICTNIEYAIDSIILLKYGSINKYVELLNQEYKVDTISYKFPKTAEDAYSIIKNDYNQYFLCFPKDTVTAALMLANEIATVLKLDFMQKRLLEHRMTSTIQVLNYQEVGKDYSENMKYVASLVKKDKSIHDIFGIFVGNMDFSNIIESVLTELQMATYREYYDEQQIIRKRSYLGLFPRKFAILIMYRSKKEKNLPLSFWNSYTANKDKYKDENDFLRKEVFKKSE